MSVIAVRIICFGILKTRWGSNFYRIIFYSRYLLASFLLISNCQKKLSSSISNKRIFCSWTQVKIHCSKRILYGDVNCGSLSINDTLHTICHTSVMIKTRSRKMEFICSIFICVANLVRIRNNSFSCIFPSIVIVPPGIVS